MNDIDILHNLYDYINNQNQVAIQQWIEKKPDNYCLLYPLVAIELGCHQSRPENQENLFKRCVGMYVYAKAVELKRDLSIKKFNVCGYRKYMQEYNQFLWPLYQNFRFGREVNDTNQYTRPRLNEVGSNEYRLITSLVTDKYREESFYFLGIDDPESTGKEHEQHMRLHMDFYQKIFAEGVKLDILKKNVDKGLYDKCVSIIMKDLEKWGPGVKSPVFSNSIELAKVIAYFYYYAMIQEIILNIDLQYTDEIERSGEECIIYFNYSHCIRSIEAISGLSSNRIENIVNYFVNDGKMNLLEFPLFKIGNELLTIPSAILVNDWQFTIINGHYIKNVTIRKREKTISTITERRIKKLLSGITNIYQADTVQYVCQDSDGNSVASDIDYAIYDITRNRLLIIEAKWMDKHYKDEIDKQYGKILDTIIHVRKQIDKHKIFLSEFSNLDYLFAKDEKYVRPEVFPDICFLGVDKRNQMHIDGYHLVSEYMLMAFLRESIDENELNLDKFWKIIDPLNTKFEYFECSGELSKITMGDTVVFIEQNELNESVYS